MMRKKTKEATERKIVWILPSVMRSPTLPDGLTDVVMTDATVTMTDVHPHERAEHGVVGMVDQTVLRSVNGATPHVVLPGNQEPGVVVVTEMTARNVHLVIVTSEMIGRTVGPETETSVARLETVKSVEVELGDREEEEEDGETGRETAKTAVVSLVMPGEKVVPLVTSVMMIVDLEIVTSVKIVDPEIVISVNLEIVTSERIVAPETETIVDQGIVTLEMIVDREMVRNEHLGDVEVE